MASDSLEYALQPNDLVVPSCIVRAAGEVVEANEKFLALCGKKREAFTPGRMLADYLTFIRADGPYDLIKQSAFTIAPFRIEEIEIETSKSQRRWVGMSVVPRSVDGSMTSALLIFTDVTHEKIDQELGRSRWGREQHASPSLEEARRLLEEAKRKIDLFNLTVSAHHDHGNDILAAAHSNLERAFSDMNEELDMARTIQEGLLPDKLPDAVNLKSSALYIPAGKVGGDLYDMIITPRQKVAILIFDVSGHGVPAALIAAMAKMLFMHYIDRVESPAEVFAEVNRRLCKFVKSEHYLTAFLGILDPIGNSMVYAKAGHVPPLVYHGGSGEVTSLKARGFFIGHAALADLAEYSEERVELEPGDKLFFYTDGLTEGANADNELYGQSRLVQSLKTCGSQPVAAVLEYLLEDQSAFRHGVPLRDDFTMLCVETGSAENFLAESGFTQSDKPRIAAATSYGSIEEIAATVLREMDRNGYSDLEIKRTKVCIFEMLTNAIDHGNRGDPAKRAVVAYKVTPEDVRISVIDEGDGFDYHNLPDPLTPENLMKDHGRGIFLVKRYMDHVSFNARGNRIMAAKFHREGR